MPDNGPGSQDAYSGSGYAGIIVNWNDQPYDYLYAPLNEELRAGERYCVSMWVSCADQPRLATDDLCIFFTSEVPSGEALDTLTYALRNPVGNVLDNTQEWVQLSDNITAQGNERFIVIGSCRSGAINFAPLNASSFFDPDTYYYIDEVSVIPENFELEIEAISNPSGVYCSDDSVVLRTNLGAVGSSVWSDGTSNSSMTITTSGTYSVTTQVGCSTYEAQLEINFEDCSCNLLVSNVFTPNDDGKNDVFQLTPVIEVARFELKIYNRWGKLVFETQDAQQGWNGQINGSLASPGVYLWTAKIFCIKNNQLLDKELKGYVSLLK